MSAFEEQIKGPVMAQGCSVGGAQILQELDEKPI
jgi:hypothetical protein